MAFHAAGNALVRLFLGLFEKVPAEKHPEEKGQENDHERRADEFGQRELPAQERNVMMPSLDRRVGGSISNAIAGREMRAFAKIEREAHCRVGA